MHAQSTHAYTPTHQFENYYFVVKYSILCTLLYCTVKARQLLYVYCIQYSAAEYYDNNNNDNNSNVDNYRSTVQS
jgi:hypothetical protein